MDMKCKKRTEKIEVNLTEEEKERIRKKANELGMGMSPYMRMQSISNR